MPSDLPVSEEEIVDVVELLVNAIKMAGSAMAHLEEAIERADAVKSALRQPRHTGPVQVTTPATKPTPVTMQTIAKPFDYWEHR